MNIQSQRDLFTVIKAMSGQSNTLVVPRELIRFTGDINTALLLSQLMYWTDKADDGWIYKTYNEWESEIMVNEYHVRKSTRWLEKMGFLETKVKKANGNPTVHYRIKVDEFSVSFLHFLQERTYKVCRNDPAQIAESLTEITTKTTTEITTHNRGVKNTRSNRVDYPEEFETFWGFYPRRLNKKSAFKKWTAQLNKGVSPESMIYAAKNYALDCKNKRTTERYQMHPETFLGPDDKFERFINGIPDMEQEDYNMQLLRDLAHEGPGDLFDI